MNKSSRRVAEIGGTGRWSAKPRAEAVLRLLKREDLDTLSWQLKVTSATLSGWRKVCLVSDDETLSTPELYRLIVEALDRWARMFKVPVALMRALGRRLDSVPRSID